MHTLSDRDARRLLLFTPQLSCIANLDGYLEWVHPAWTEALGWTAEELCAQPFLDLVHPDDHGATTDEMARLADGEVTLHFVNRYRHKDGGWRWLDWVARPSPDGRIYSCARQIDDRKRKDAMLRTRLDQLNMAERMANVGHWRLELTADRPSWSRQVYAIHGRDPALAEPVVADAIHYYHPDDQPTLQALMAHTAETGEPFQFRLRLIREDGVERLVECQAAAERDPSGAVEALVGVFQDVTEQESLRRRLDHIERLATVGNLAAGVAHEVNNPLTYVSFNAEALMDELDALTSAPTDAHRALLLEMARDIQAGAARIATIVQSLRTFSPQPGAVELRPLRLADEVAAALRSVEAVWRPRVRLDVALPADLPPVLGHPAHLVQSVAHLIQNAAQASRPADGEPPLLRVRATREGESTVVLEIEDHGAGMSPDVLARAFDPFYSTRRAENATGLGLYIAQSYLGSMGGAVSLVTTPGHGTVARVTLQVAPAATEEALPSAARPDAASGTGQPAGARRVLVVDDEPRLGRALVRVLHGHAVTVLTDARQALDHLAEDDRYDILLLDLTMPGMSGSALFAALPPALQARCWVLTGGAMDAADQAFREQMGARVLSKPVDAQRLRAVVAGVPAVSRAE